MENTQITINWSEAQEISQEVNQKRTQEQEKALQEFKESSHEMTDARDLMYYLEATGTEEKDIFNLIQHATNLSPLITQPLQAGATLDDLMYVDPYIEPEEEDEPETEQAQEAPTNQSIKEFTDYFNEFYGVNGVYPIEDTTEETIKKHIEIIKQAFPKYQFEGDSFDREEIRDLIFTTEQLQKAYKNN